LKPSFWTLAKVMRKLSAACLLFALAGCLGTGRSLAPDRAAYAASSPPVGIVFVANGAGDFHTVSEGLSQVVVETCAPVRVETFAWSHGYRRYVLDQVDHDNHLIQGSRLAALVIAHRQACPMQRVYLVAHSAGCAVALAAAEQLPPNTVDRIVLLAPSVCQNYDLRPALRTARISIDVFYSSEDRWILGLGMRLFGTTERECSIAAGRYGFAPVIACPADADLYGKLRQHPWDPVVQWSGHDGGHFGNNQPDFMRAYVLPLLLSDN
jgi:pimeloyl-ACP methyl ester carboxylesterase